MPKHTRRLFRELNVRGFVFEHEQGGGVVHLVSGSSGTVAVEEGREGSGRVGIGRRDGDEDGHLFGSIDVPAVEEFEKSRPLVEVFGAGHWFCGVVAALLPFSGGAKEFYYLTAEVDYVVGVHVVAALRVHLGEVFVSDHSCPVWSM